MAAREYRSAIDSNQPTALRPWLVGVYSRLSARCAPGTAIRHFSNVWQRIQGLRAQLYSSPLQRPWLVYARWPVDRLATIVAIAAAVSAIAVAIRFESFV